MLQEVVVALRTIRSENNVPPDSKGAAIVIPEDAAACAWLAQQRGLITMFAKLSALTVDTAAAKPKFAGQAVVRGCQVYLQLEGLIDRDVEIERLGRELARTSGLSEAAAKRLESPKFRERAPAEVVAKEEEKLRGLCANVEKLQRSLDALKAV